MMWVIFGPFKKIARFETCLNIPNELFYKKDEQEKILYMSKKSYF